MRLEINVSEHTAYEVNGVRVELDAIKADLEATVIVKIEPAQPGRAQRLTATVIRQDQKGPSSSR